MPLLLASLCGIRGRHQAEDAPLCSLPSTARMLFSSARPHNTGYGPIPHPTYRSLVDPTPHALSACVEGSAFLFYTPGGTTTLFTASPHPHPAPAPSGLEHIKGLQEDGPNAIAPHTATLATRCIAAFFQLLFFTPPLPWRGSVFSILAPHATYATATLA